MTLYLNRQAIDLIKQAKALCESAGFTFAQTNSRYNGKYLKACRVYRQPQDKGKAKRALYTLYNQSDLEFLIDYIKNKQESKIMEEIKEIPNTPAADMARCSFCGYEGIYRQEIVDQDYYDGHDTIKLSCRDVEACFKRGGRTRAIY